MIRSDIIKIWSDLIGSDNINVRSFPIRSNISDIGLDLIGFKISDIKSNPIGSDIIDIGYDLFILITLRSNLIPVRPLWLSQIQHGR